MKKDICLLKKMWMFNIILSHCTLLEVFLPNCNYIKAGKIILLKLAAVCNYCKQSDFLNAFHVTHDYLSVTD